MEIKYFYPAIIWSLLIVIASWTAAVHNLPPTLFDIFETDKVGHFGIYAILFLTIIYGFVKNNAVTRKIIAAVVFWCCFYGFLMEVLQYFFFPGRFFEFPDIVANIIGSFTGLIFYQLFKNKLDILKIG